jgi:3'-5' exoribonuclease
MAARLFIADLVREGLSFDETFLLSEKELRTTNAGKLFVRGTLQDRTGTCRMIIWQATEKFYEALPRGGFVRARGRVEIYQSHPQLLVETCLPVDEDSVDLADFMPATTQDVTALEAELRRTLGTIADPAVKALADEFLGDAPLMKAFCRAPAAKVNHHAYLGGLLEHTVSMLRLAERVVPLYPVLNRDLVLLGVFLHDIGKTVELCSDRSFEYTDGGRLVGHLVEGAMMIGDKARRLRERGTAVPDILVQQIVHLVLAHHGQYEFGSPKLPVTAEAVVLHYLDNLDAKLTAFAAAVATHPAEEEDWTSRQFMFDNQMLFRGTADDRRAKKLSGTPGAAATNGDVNGNAAGDGNGAAPVEETPAKRPPRRGGLD